VGLDDTLRSELVRRILPAAQPDRIILLGSAANGQMSRDSDIDLLIVEPEPGDTRAESIRIRRALGSIGYPIDVIVISTDRFEESRGVIGCIAYPANKYGQVLYAAIG
jgi:uncharacterized protein